jgi:hypothetical protein
MDFEIKSISGMVDCINNITPQIIILCKTQLEARSIRKQIKNKYIGENIHIKSYLQEPPTGVGYDLFFISSSLGKLNKSQPLSDWLTRVMPQTKHFYFE